MIVADQVPAKLAPDVVKNTALKIAHRVVADDDRPTLGGAMAWPSARRSCARDAAAGEAAVFADGDDAPLLIKVPQMKGFAAAEWPSNEAVAGHMAARAGAVPLPTSGCEGVCAAGSADAVCESARTAMESVAFRRALDRTMLSAIANPRAIHLLWPDIAAVVDRHRPAWVAPAEMLTCAAVRGAHDWVEWRGRLGGWTYADTRRVAAAVRNALLCKIGGDDRGADRAVADVPELLTTIYRRENTGRLCCARLSDADPPCPFRAPAGALASSGEFDQAWAQRFGRYRAADRRVRARGLQHGRVPGRRLVAGGIVARVADRATGGGVLRPSHGLRTRSPCCRTTRCGS